MAENMGIFSQLRKKMAEIRTEGKIFVLKMTCRPIGMC